MKLKTVVRNTNLINRTSIKQYIIKDNDTDVEREKKTNFEYSLEMYTKYFGDKSVFKTDVDMRTNVFACTYVRIFYKTLIIQ
jgi:hypothetical protein